MTLPDRPISPSSTRRILCLVSDLNQVGGIQGYNRSLTKALREGGAEVLLVERRPGRLGSKLRFLFAIGKAVLCHHPEYVLCTHLHFAPVGRFLKKLFGIPFGVSAYGIEVAEIRQPGHRKAIMDAAPIVYLFEHTMSQLEAQIPGTRAKSFPLMSAVDGRRFRVLESSEPLRRALGTEGRRVLLTLGRMSRADGDNKGYRRVLEALPRVIAAVPEVLYVLAGGGDDLENVRAWVRDHGLEAHVALPGAPEFEALPHYYNLAELFVLPSKHEGFPAIVMLEALACGVPVIGGDQPGAEEALLHGALGCTVPSDNVGRIAEALITALQAPPEPWKDREALRTLALERYGEPRFSAEVRELLRRIEAEIAG